MEKSISVMSIYICMTECILFLIQGLAEVASLLLSLSLSVPLMLGCDEVSCYINFDSCQARMGDTKGGQW